MRCPACKSEVSAAECELGSLGRLKWFRCRYCGMDFSMEKPLPRSRSIQAKAALVGSQYVLRR